MPKAYEQIKQKFLSKGSSLKDAEERAAKIFNAKIRKPGQPAMGPNYEARARKAHWTKP
jgi:hypothetical protein